MEKWDRFVAKHQRGCRIAMTILWLLWALWVMDLGFPKFLIYIIGVVGIFVFSVTISASTSRLLKKPLEIMNQQGDPEPFLREMTAQLTYPGNEGDKQVRRINYAMALRQTGQYAQAEALLRSINIDRYPGMLPVMKASYYNNLMDICVLTGKNQEAKIWYEKAVQIFADIKNEKQRKNIEKTIAINRAWYCYAGENDAEALRILESIPPENLLQQIDTAMMCARIYLRMGQKDQAVQALRFVEQFGNKLYAVQEARQMLAELEEMTNA